MSGIHLLSVNFSLFLPAVVLGAISSMHCVGMCGPIAFALPGMNGGMWKRWGSIGLYNLGRVLSYAVIGTGAGLIGRTFYEYRWHQWFSVIAGLLIIVVVLSGKWYKRKGPAPKYVVKLQHFTGKWFHSEKHYAPFLIGIGNGFLPCGVVYLAVISASGMSQSVADGAFFMAAFGVGTIPALLALSAFGFFFRASVRASYKRMIPYISILAGVLLILRGMNLGIPFLSPEINNLMKGAIHCANN